MSVQGISHITFVVKDLERAKQFFCDGLGAEEVYDSSEKKFSISKGKFFVLGGVWLAAMEGEPSTDRTYRHFAFHTTDDELPRLEERLRTIRIEFKPPRPRVLGEGQSLYFYDFDDHLFELHTGTLQQRLDRYEAE